MSFSSPVTLEVTADITTDARKYTQILQLESDDQNDGPGLALRAPGVPAIGDTHAFGSEFDDRAYLISKTTGRDKETKIYTVTLQYTTLDREKLKKFDHPLDRPAEISSTYRNITAICERDINGNVIDSSAGQIFDPPAEREDARKVLTVTRNFSLYNGGFAFMNRINSIAYLGAAAKTLRVTRFDEDRVIEEYGPEGSALQVEYWKRTVAMEYKPDTWTKQLLDAGTLDSTGAKLLVNGMTVTEPVKLNGAGAVLNPQSGAPTFLSFDVYFTANFDSMGLFA